jgi:hypothetical protein
VIKGTARKVRRLTPGGKTVLCGFAGSTADAFTLLERLEKKLESAPGQLQRAAVELELDVAEDFIDFPERMDLDLGIGRRPLLHDLRSAKHVAAALPEGLIAPDAIFHVPGRSEPMRGPAGYLAIIGMMRAGFPDIRWTLEEMVAEGDKVAARYTMRGTHRDAFFGIPPTGKTIAV